MSKTATRYSKHQIVHCSCGCMGHQQILKIDASGAETRYKVAYYNAIVGGRHWVTEKELRPF